MTTFLLFGFLIGMRHALEADHVAAVASLAMNNRGRKGVVRLGAAWGLGHTLTLFTVGLAALYSGQAVPERFAAYLEMAVGVMLIVLGAGVIWRLVRDRVHFHTHRHGGGAHFHAHSHAGEGVHESSAHRHVHPPVPAGRALLVGLMHGMAGSAALVVLALGAMDSFWSGVGYLLLFGVGSMAGMALFTCAMAVPLRYAARNFTWAYNGLTAVVGLGTVVLGAVVIYRAGSVIGGLPGGWGGWLA